MKKAMTAVKYIWILAVIVFVSLYFYSHFDSIIRIIHLIPLVNLLIAFTTLFLAKVLLSYTSLLSVNYLDINISFFKMFSIYNITQLAKYIPGSIWQFIGKAGAYSKENMNISQIKKSILIEMIWVLMSAFVLGSVLVISGNLLKIEFIFHRVEEFSIYYLIAFLIFMSIAIIFYKRSYSFIAIFLSHPYLNIKMACTLIAVWFLLGMSFFITLTPFIETVHLSLFIDIVGLYAIAYAIGFLVPFAPAGIGIREAILVAGLNVVLPTQEAIILASLNRMIYIILEVIIVIMLFQTKLFKYKKHLQKGK